MLSSSTLCSELLGCSQESSDGSVRETERARNGHEKKKRSQRESASCALTCKRGAHTAKDFVLFCFVAVASFFLCTSSLCRRCNNQFGLVWNLFLFLCLFLLGKAKQSFSGKS